MPTVKYHKMCMKNAEEAVEYHKDAIKFLKEEKKNKKRWAKEAKKEAKKMAKKADAEAAKHQR